MFNITPKADLSVIITNFNKPHEQIEQCVESVLGQTIQPKEIFLIDDHSDNPITHDKINSFVLPKNVGPAKARDFGVRMSKCKLILFVDSDDILQLDFIERCGEKILHADIVYPNIIFFGAVKENRLCKLPNSITKNYLKSEIAILPVTSMMRKEVYQDLGGFKELPFYEDWEFFIRAFNKGYHFAHANTNLLYRQSRNARMQKPLEERVEVYQTHIKPLLQDK
jgi:glycosyltransferase involved in cell wall biosynthesis